MLEKSHKFNVSRNFVTWKVQRAVIYARLPNGPRSGIEQRRESLRIWGRGWKQKFKRDSRVMCVWGQACVSSSVSGLQGPALGLGLVSSYRYWLDMGNEKEWKVVGGGTERKRGCKVEHGQKPSHTLQNGQYTNGEHVMQHVDDVLAHLDPVYFLLINVTPTHLTMKTKMMWEEKTNRTKPTQGHTTLLVRSNVQIETVLRVQNVGVGEGWEVDRYTWLYIGVITASPSEHTCTLWPGSAYPGDKGRILLCV